MGTSMRHSWSAYQVELSTRISRLWYQSRLSRIVAVMTSDLPADRSAPGDPAACGSASAAAGDRQRHQHACPAARARRRLSRDGRLLHRQRRAVRHRHQPARLHVDARAGGRRLRRDLRPAARLGRAAGRRVRPQAAVHRRHDRVHADLAALRTGAQRGDPGRRPGTAGRGRGDDGSAGDGHVQATTTGHHRLRAMALFGATGGLAAVVGQVVGGLLVDADIAGSGWRPIFLVNVPIGLVALALAPRLLPDSRALRPAPDRRTRDCPARRHSAGCARPAQRRSRTGLAVVVVGVAAGEPVPGCGSRPGRARGTSATGGCHWCRRRWFVCRA